MIRLYVLTFYFLLCLNDFCIAAQLKSSLLPGNDVCGKVNPEEDGVVLIIFNGDKTDLGKFPWLALLESNDGEFECGGALISNRYVLTAAHCVEDIGYPVVRVRLGEHNVRTDPDCDDEYYCADPLLKVEIEDTIIHKNYIPSNKNLLNDIALLRLKSEVNFTDFIKPICLPHLPELTNETFTGRFAVAAGWGQTEKKWRSDEKRHVELPIVSNDDCTEVYRKHEFAIQESHVCAGGKKGRDSCHGDSGGPLMYQHKKDGKANWVCIGIVSYGLSRCGTEGIPGVYTRVEKYLEWILDNIKP